MNRLTQLQQAAASSPPSADSAAPPPPPGSEVAVNVADAADSKSHAVVSFKMPDDSEDYKETEEQLSKFYSTVDETQKLIDQVVQQTATIEAKHSENLQTVDETKSAAIRAELDELAAEINGLAQNIKGKLEVMAKSTEEMRATPELEQANAGVVKIQQNQHSHLLTAFVNAMQSYQRVQTDSEQRYREQTERRIKIRYTNPDGTAIDDATAHELALEVIEHGASNAIFQQSKDTLAQIIETRNDIYRIEQSMRELNQLFNDLAVLVNEQGEIMDVILQNVRNSVQYVQKGRKELKKARKYQKKSRKKLICLIVCVVVLIIVFVVAGVIGGTIKINK